MPVAADEAAQNDIAAQNDTLEEARREFIAGMSQISQFWGYPKAMGAIYGALYLAPEALSLDDLAEQVGVTKGAISTNVRRLERLGMVHRQVRLGERRDFYIAEADFWKIVRRVLQERGNSEFDRALRTVGDSLDRVRQAEHEPAAQPLAAHYQDRLQNMQSFFNSLDNLVAMILTLDDLRSGSIRALIGRLQPGPDLAGKNPEQEGETP